jgi:hypothetical protein
MQQPNGQTQISGRPTPAGRCPQQLPLDRGQLPVDLEVSADGEVLDLAARPVGIIAVADIAREVEDDSSKGDLIEAISEGPS